MMPPVTLEHVRLIRLIALGQVVCRLSQSVRPAETDRLSASLRTAPTGHLFTRLGTLLPAVSDQKSLFAWLDDETVAGSVEGESRRAFATESQPVVWVASAQHIRRIRRFLNHADTHLKTIRDAEQFRGRSEAGTAELMDRLRALIDDSVSCRTQNDPVAYQLADRLDRLIHTAGPDWPVNLLLRLASLTGAGDWFDSLKANASDFANDAGVSPSLTLAEWIAGHLPDRPVYPGGELSEIFDTLSGGRVRLWRADTLPAPNRGWLTRDLAGETLCKSGGWLFMTTPAVAEMLPLGETSAPAPPVVGITTPSVVPPPVPPPVPAPVVTAAKPDFPSDAPAVFNSASADFRSSTDPHARRESLERMLNELALLRDTPANVADSLLDIIRRLAREDGLTVLPEDWSHARPPRWDATAVPADTTLLHKVSEQQPKGTLLNVRQFGLRSGGPGPAYRPARVEVSVGRMPAGYAEVIRLIQEHRSDSPGYRAIRERVGAWVTNLWEGRFEEELKRFFVDLHGDLGDVWRRENPAAADALRTAFLNMFLGEFNYSLFEPRTRERSQWDWMIPVGDKPPRTNQVRRIVQPGLFDSRKRLIVPARVEME
ncbi:hypothetical protein [Zavarzinella formosa]|uniref:hypothetical protein n=1 Tax=Zavarzinella formosa TaxID=360055 RepID=UPI000312158C|nr:hypothetical protein [Zavarzinella formosa]